MFVEVGHLCFKLFSSEFSGSFGLLLDGGFFLAFGVDSGVSLFAFLNIDWSIMEPFWRIKKTAAIFQ